MAANAELIVGDGVIEIPLELRNDPRLRVGTRLVLVRENSLVEVKPQAQISGDWRKLEGILAGRGLDATTVKHKEREWELAHDERKFGTKRPDW